MRTESLLEWVKVIEIGPQGFVYVVDSKGQIAFHSRKPGQREIVDVSAAEIDMKRKVEEVLKEVHVAGERRSNLVLKALPPARGDATLLRQAWSNLLDNAIKFSGKRERPVIEVSGSENGVECVYCVKDNGAGFDMQYYQ